MHYLRKWSGKDMDAPIPARDYDPPIYCSVEGCLKKHLSKGYCSLHYQRIRNEVPLNTKPRVRHGSSSIAEYGVWEGIIQRCTNPRCSEYINYGGRGINICEDWLDFKNFIADMGLRPSGRYSIERENNEEGYNPDNCKWATSLEQGYNKRTSVIITAFGFTGCIAQVARKFNVVINTLQDRIRRGIPPEEAVLLG